MKSVCWWYFLFGIHVAMFEINLFYLFRWGDLEKEAIFPSVIFPHFPHWKLSAAKLVLLYCSESIVNIHEISVVRWPLIMFLFSPKKKRLNCFKLFECEIYTQNIPLVRLTSWNLQICTISSILLCFLLNFIL